MSSKASPRSAQRKSTQAQLKKQIVAMNNDLGQAKMAVLNMRQMYRNAEQELLGLQETVKGREALIAALVLKYGTDGVAELPADTSTLIREGYMGFEFSEGEDNALVITLTPVDYDDEG